MGKRDMAVSGGTWGKFNKAASVFSEPLAYCTL